MRSHNVGFQETKFDLSVSDSAEDSQNFCLVFNRSNYLITLFHAVTAFGELSDHWYATLSGFHVDLVYATTLVQFQR